MSRFHISISAIALLCLVVLPGCDSAESKSAGNYMLDKEHMKSQVEAEMASASEADKAAMQMALQMLDSMSMSIELNADGSARSTVSLAGESQTSSGTWTLSGKNVSITMTDPEGNAETITGTLDGEVLELSPPADADMPGNMVFRKRATS